MPDTGHAADRPMPVPRPAPMPGPMAALRPSRARLGPAGQLLAVLLLATLLLLAASFAAITRRDHDTALEEGWIAVERAALGAVEHAERGLDAARLVTDRVAEVVRREGGGVFRGTGHADLAALLRYAPQIGAIWILGPAGDLIATSFDPDPPPISFARGSYFPPLRDGADSALAPLRFGRVSQVWFFSYNRAVRDADGAFLGIVQASLHAEDFQRFQRGLGLGPDGEVGLFRARDGAPLMLSELPPGNDEVEPPAMRGAPPAAVLRAAASGTPRQGRFEASAADGTALLVAWRRAEMGGAVLAVASQPRDRALAPFRARLQRSALLFGLAGLAVAGLGGAVAAALASVAASGQAALAGRRDLVAVLEAAADGVLVLDAGGRIGFVNTRAALVLGRGADLAGRTLHEALPDLAGGPIRQACEETLRDRARAVAEATEPGLGRRFRAEAHPREDGGVVVFFRDVTEPHRAAASLADSEARLRLAVEATGLATWDEDMRAGLTVWNLRAFDILGLEVAQGPVAATAWRTLVHPEDLPRVEAAYRDALRDGTLYRCEHRIRRPDREQRWIEPLGRFLRDAEGRPVRFVGVFSDITERKAAEAALAESEARLRRVLDSLFVFVGVLSPDGIVLEANQAPLDAAGLTAADVLGRPFWDCHWWTHDARIQDRLRDACRRAALGEPSRYDVEVRAQGDGRMTIDFQIAPLFDAAGRVTHLIPSATDVTARRAAEAALSESEGRLRLAQEAGEVGVFERVVPGDTHWSAAMFRLYGLDPAGRGPWVAEADHLAMLHPDDRERFRAQRAAMWADPAQSRFTFEFRISRADTGEERWIATRGEVLRDAAGGPRIIRGVNQDISDRRRAEERQALLAREVDHRAKNALAVVQSIVGLTRDADPERFRTAVIGRIAAMARAHTLLAREGWDGAELRELLEAEVAPYRGDDASGAMRVALSGPRVTLAAGAAQPIAMALHELATNAAKYGALSLPAGRVEVAWAASGDGGLVLRWTEGGGPPLDGPPARRGFGSSVIRNTIERQLGGETSFDWPPEGLVCTLSLPAGQLRWPAASGATAAGQLRS